MLRVLVEQVCSSYNNFKKSINSPSYGVIVEEKVLLTTTRGSFLSITSKSKKNLMQSFNNTKKEKKMAAK